MYSTFFFDNCRIENAPPSRSAAQIVGSKNFTSKVCAIRAGWSGKFICADTSGNECLAAKATCVSTSEKFDLIQSDENHCVLQSHANRRFVRLGDGDDTRLFNNETDLSYAEKFKVIHLANGKIALQATNRMFVCADSFRGGKLFANRNNLLGWEKFDLVEEPHFKTGE